MKTQLLFTLIISLFALNSWGQDAKFEVQVSTDSVLMDNYFKVEFSLENTGGDQFSPPEFRDFDVVGGPNQSSSMSFVNGVMSQSKSYSFYLKPREVGTFYIEPSSIQVEGQILESEPIEVNVYPNPDGVRQDPEIRQQERPNFFSNPWKERKEKKKEKAKKKRKTYRI